MTDKKLSTDSYKGVRDFYPEDMSVQRYIFNTWIRTAESFGFTRYDASILEPADLYKAKGTENEELINEQTYTFTDRGNREVTLRPEMTPTIARMVAAKRRELAFPLRWYSIPNLFRYERPQKGRLREHWQLNCDIFGADDVSADVEMIALAYQTLIDFGVKPETFRIHLNNRKEMLQKYADIGITDSDTVKSLTQLNDRKNKMNEKEYLSNLTELVSEKTPEVIALLENRVAISDPVFYKSKEVLGEKAKIMIDRTLSRGFDYYTGTIFEIFEVDSDGNSTGRSILGGGRYDNLTSIFPGEPISGVGFGMGDVTMRDFLETHNLIPDSIKNTGTKVVIIPMSAEQNIFSQAIAKEIRQAGPSVSVDISTKKIEKKIISARNSGSKFIIVTGEDEMKSKNFTLKNLTTGEEKTDNVSNIAKSFKIT